MNTNIKSLLIIFTLSLTFPAASVFAEDQVYGWQLMSEQERLEHRTKMQSMETQEETNQYRLEHRSMMEQRAKEQGVTLPDVPQNHNNMMDRRGGGGMGGSGMGGGGRR